MINFNVRPSCARFAAALLFMVSLAAGGCLGSMRAEQQFRRAQAINTPEAYEEFLANTSDTYLRGQAREALAGLRSAALSEPASAGELRAFVESFGDTAAGAARREQLPEAILRDEVLTQQGDPARLSESLDAWTREYPDAARQLNANDLYNEVLIARIRREQLHGVQLVQLVGAMRLPGAEKRRALEGALMKLFELERTDAPFVAAIRSDLPSWLSVEARDAIVRQHMERFEENLVTDANSADEIRPFLQRMNEKALASRRGSALRKRYDELLFAELGNQGTIEQAMAYLGDPFTQLARGRLQNEVDALRAEVSAAAIERFDSLLASEPRPYLAEAMRRRQMSMKRIIDLERERDFVLTPLITPENPHVSLYRRFRPVEPQEIKLQERNPAVLKSNVYIEAENIHTTGLVLSESGVILCLQYVLAKLNPTTGTLILPDGGKLALVGRGSDPLTGFVLFAVKDVEDPLAAELVPAVLKSPERIYHSRTVDIRFNLEETAGLKVGGQIEEKNNDLPGSKSHQTFKVITTSRVTMDGGVAYTTEGWMTGPAEDQGTGEAFAMAARAAEEGKWYLLGINEAHDLVAAYYEDAIREIEKTDRPVIIDQRPAADSLPPADSE